MKSGTLESNKAVFIDRDGPILTDKEYISDPEAVKLAEGAVAGIKLLRQAGYKVIIISNQSGVGRGMFTLEQAKAVHQRMLNLLADSGAEIEDAFYCYHAPDDKCTCRKPQPTMIFEAARKYDIDLSKSFMGGDKPSDLETGRNANANMRTVLIGEKEGQPLTIEKEHLADYECPDFLAAARWIVEKE